MNFAKRNTPANEREQRAGTKWINGIEKALPTVPSSQLHTEDDVERVSGDFPAKQATADWYQRTYSQPKHKRFNVRTKGNSFWLWEILSCILAIVALGAIVLTLAIHQGKPQPDWPSLISINSLVAIFTGVMKAAFLLPITESISELKWMWFAAPRPVSDFEQFDLASRGPLGSLLLLLQRPRNLLASAGALITILALAVDPFTQQVLQYYSCTFPVDGIVATVPKTNIYDKAGASTGAASNNLDIPMFSAIYQALYDLPGNGNVSQLMPIQCPTGNCTFSTGADFTYRSLAICSKVTDITHLVTPGEIPPGLSEDQAPANYSFANLNVFYITGDGGYFMETHALTNEIAGDTGSTLGGFYALMITSECDGNTTCPVVPFAFAASWYPCLNTYGNVAISNFELQEQLIESTQIPQTPPFLSSSLFDSTLAYATIGDYPASPGVDCSPSNRPQGPKTLPTYTALTRDRIIQYPTTPEGDLSRLNPYMAPKNGSFLYYDPQCAYGISARVYFAISQLWNQIFTGNSPIGMDVSNNLTSNTAGRLDSAIGDGVLQVLYQNGRVNLTSATQYVQGIADAMTRVVRTQGAIGVPSNGTMLSNQTCIRVKWEWLTMPISLLFSTILIFAMTVIACRRNTKEGAPEAGRRPWKSSALPLLWCGLQDADRMKYGMLHSVDDMTDCGKELEVSLVRKKEWIPEKYSGQEFGTRPGRWILRQSRGHDLP